MHGVIPDEYGGPTLEFDVVDVFGASAYAGNQLAVVHGAAGLEDGQLLAIAREFGFSETTFPEPLDAGRYRVRIFTVDGEIPFAGHPTLGTAAVLRDRGLLASASVVQECGAGDIGVVFAPDRVAPSAAPRDLPREVDPAVAGSLLEDLGLHPDDLDGPAHVAGTGLDFVYLPVRPEALGRARGSLRRLSSYGEALSAGTRDPVEGLALYVADDRGDPLAVRVRVFLPGAAAEDAATGSATAGLGLVLAGSQLPDGGAYRVSQGVEMGRPSRLDGLLEARAGRVTRVHVAGQVHPVARGTLAAPGGAPAS